MVWCVFVMWKLRGYMGSRLLTASVSNKLKYTEANSWWMKLCGFYKNSLRRETGSLFGAQSRCSMCLNHSVPSCVLLGNRSV